ncbi:PAAR domain-containing protein [Candidatus Mesenet endosymbiont of Phosphuga atrata]|uniref:PAAR domain-containing protein n=1 Tax=Candidatus Mesenet endosymbiont of Phosphuga atrata TaxID=3066221 RepID=UPI0030D4CA29
MSKSVVRVGDSCEEDVPHFSTHGSSNVFVNGKPIARKSDSFTAGKKIIQGSETVFVGGLGMARVGDLVSCGFKIKNGSDNVFSGD